MLSVVRFGFLFKAEPCTFQLNSHYRIQHPVRDFPLAGLRDGLSAGVREDCHGIALGIEADSRLLDIVEHDGVQ